MQRKVQNEYAYRRKSENQMHLDNVAHEYSFGKK